MDVSRRGFFKISGAALAASGIGIGLKPVEANAQPLKIKYAKETTTVCPYCSVGCGIIVSTRNGKVVNTEGDPDHPIKGVPSARRAAQSTRWPSTNRLANPSTGRLRDGMERGRLGMGPGQDCQKRQDSRDKSFNHQRQGRGRQPDEASPRRQRRHGQRRVLYLSEIPEGVGPGVYRTPGPYLTQRNCSGSGRVVWTRRNDESLDRFQEQ